MLEPMKAIEWQEGPIEMRLAPTKGELLHEIDQMLSRVRIKEEAELCLFSSPCATIPLN